MIIWKGWGILGVVFPALGAAIGAAIGAGALKLDKPEPIIGLFVALGALGAFLVGRAVNGPQAVERARNRWRSALHEQVQQGAFALPGHPRPSSLDEAYEQADWYVDQQMTHSGSRFRNQHTLFFIPLQYAGLLGVVLGIAIAISSLVG